MDKRDEMGKNSWGLGFYWFNGGKLSYSFKVLRRILVKCWRENLHNGVWAHKIVGNFPMTFEDKNEISLRFDGCWNNQLIGYYEAC